jgi:hypothetical protein
MTRVFNVVSNMDLDTNFKEFYTTLMGMLLLLMFISFFSYRSLLTSVILLYSACITKAYSKEIKKYVSKMCKDFKPVLTPYSVGCCPDESDFDEGYEEECDDTNKDE